MFYQNRPKAEFTNIEYLDSIRLHERLLRYITSQDQAIKDLLLSGAGEYYFSSNKIFEADYKHVYYQLNFMINNFRNRAFDYMSGVEELSNLQIITKYTKSICS